MTTHNYEESAKIKAAIFKEKKEQAQKHINFINSYCDAWQQVEKKQPNYEWVNGANFIYKAYCELHNLPDLCADDLIEELAKI